MAPANIIAEIGLALWGRSWPQEMARALGVDRSTVYGWRDGRQTPRRVQWVKLREVAEERVAATESAARLCYDTIIDRCITQAEAGG